MASPPEHLMPRPIGQEPFPREVLAEHHRERILGAALEIFAKRGYRGTTVGHLVAGARVGVNSFYSLFEGKEDCFISVYGLVAAEGRQRMAAAVGADAPWPQRARAVLRAMLEFIEEKPLAARIALVEVHTVGPT